MKLYFSPGACSLAPHIVLREAGLTPTLVKVDLASHRTADGADFYAITSKGQVPLLELVDGTRLRVRSSRNTSPTRPARPPWCPPPARPRATS
jgi:glutathione S-transferase